jgi:hypothetical protein
MREVVSRWESSGLTQKAFASREQIPYSMLLYWRRRLGKTGSKSRDRRAAPVLSPVRIVPDVPRGGLCLQVRTRDGLVVTVPAGFDSSELSRLLGALSQC